MTTTDALGIRPMDYLHLPGGTIVLVTHVWGQPTHSREVGVPQRLVHVQGHVIDQPGIDGARHLTYAPTDRVEVTR